LYQDAVRRRKRFQQHPAPGSCELERVLQQVRQSSCQNLAIDVYGKSRVYARDHKFKAAGLRLGRSGDVRLFDEFRNLHSFASLRDPDFEPNVKERLSAKILHALEASI